MNPDSDEKLVENIRRQLEQHADNLDELSAARLAAARRHALAQSVPRRHGWLALSGVGAAAALLLAVLVVHQGARPDGDWDILTSTEDMDLIEELDFYAWLEATQSNS